MEFKSNTLELKGRVVFQKLLVPTFERLPKEYHENEACFVFVKQGGFQVRSQTETLQLNRETALLAKCLNYYYETIKKNGETKDNVEAIGILLYPGLIKDLFNFDINQAKYKVDFNMKQVQVNKLLEHYRESIIILLENPELADEELIKNKLREFIILMTKTIEAPTELDFLASMFKPNFAKFEEVIQIGQAAKIRRTLKKITMTKITILLTTLFLSILSTASAQDGKTSVVYTPDSVKHINKTCLYPGGQDALMKDIVSNFSVPKRAKKDKIEGKVYLQIVVDTSGFASGKILKGLRADVDSAAIDMTKKLKQFVPATMDDRKVPMTLTVPLKL